jgi:hypothetical protein
MRDEFFRFGHYFDEQHTDALFLCVARWSKRDGDRRPVLSADLRTDTEIDEAVDELMSDLEAARIAAKTALRARGASRRP